MRVPRPLLLTIACAAAIGCTRRPEVFHLSAAAPETRRTLPAGSVVGGAGRYGSHAWLGLPYAAPPLGERRWRAPAPAAPWTGTREALAFGPACVQFGSRFGGIPGVRPGDVGGDEDCLTLNIWAPPFTPTAVPTGATRLPVMVWIHGGGNTIGHALTYDGGNLAVGQQVIVVTVQYRLGPFGWFRLPALGGSDVERSGNFATLDLVRALEWVRDNIAAFGGDPGNVTIFGESAGAQNVYTLLLAPQARGLFHRAIAESGGLWRTTTAQASNATDAAEPGQAQSSAEVVLRLLERDGTMGRAAASARRAQMSDAELATFLRSRSAADILSAYTPEPTGMIDMPRVIADGIVLPNDDATARLARPDGWNRVPVMLGSNKDENKLFMFPDPKWVRMRLWVLPRVIDPVRYEATAGYLSRLWKATGVDGPAAAMRIAGAPVFAYRFDWDEEPTLLGADLGALLGAAHALEIPFVFGHWDLGREMRVIYTSDNAPGREALSRAMMTYWATFARSGQPGGGSNGLPDWPAWDGGSPDAPTYLMLDTPAGGGIRMARNAETVAGIVADVDSDRRLVGQRDRCRIFHAMALWGRGFTRAEYPTAGKVGCREFPFDGFDRE